MTPAFTDLVDEYVALRRRTGFDLSSERLYLLSFARFADGEHAAALTIDVMRRWALATDAAHPRAAAHRLALVRRFARYRLAFDPAVEVPPVGLLGPESIVRKPPHIYSDAEIGALLGEAARLAPRGGLRPRTYVALLSLLAATGLRLSEARKLRRPDVDLEQRVLVIHESKCHKSRLVPLHPSAVTALARYAAARDALPRTPRSESFFRTDRAPALLHSSVESTFRGMRRRLGWTGDGRACRPRIHDLRHTFAVRRLLRWYEEGADVHRKILSLATYLGHAKVSHVYWYLSATPELLAVTSSRFERFAHHEEEISS